MQYTLEPFPEPRQVAVKRGIVHLTDDTGNELRCLCGHTMTADRLVPEPSGRACARCEAARNGVARTRKFAG